ncbi:MAG: aldehyde dehydrogenase [Desulfobulbaceae bacterium]|nr:aldehyde dehydrogenase [Desulfobulbaceae bacterium]
MKQNIFSFDPSNGEKLGEVPAASSQDIDGVIQKAKAASKAWRRVSLEERLVTIQKAYAAAEPALHNLAELLSKEMGKDIRRSTSEVQGTIWGGPYMANSALEALRSKNTGGATIEYVPLGVAAIISPWNYPLAMANNLMMPTLMAGNSVVWKPSEETPLIAQAFFDIIHKGLPRDLLQIVHGDGSQGKTLVESDVNIIGFTGSQATGRDIMAKAAPSLKRLVMELGGNDPMIVMKDADLQAAARFAVASSFENAGQMCISTERIYVDEEVAEQFEQYITALAAQYKVGPWDMDGVNIGPIINAKQHSKIIEHIKDAVEKNARLLHGTIEHPDHFITPTVLADMTTEMRIEQEETFGPVVCVSRFADLEDAISRANDSTYGLGAVVFGNAGAHEVADRLEAGMIGVNQGVGGGGDVPWVGAKQSGFGFHGSAEGHHQFAQVRVVSR